MKSSCLPDPALGRGVQECPVVDRLVPRSAGHSVRSCLEDSNWCVMKRLISGDAMLEIEIPMSSNAPKLLLVDDDQMAVVLMVRVASSMGYHCTTARSGASGFREFARSEFDAVITDINMSGGDGVVLARRIRSRSKVPILAVTGLESQALAACGIEDVPGVSVLRKPFTPTTLRDAIQDLVGSGSRESKMVAEVC